ncbi:recombinase family protein [Hoyosella sp. YIM 151337]|nr:recombinase family protein [Hoyosella sp. YIM 151337]MCW4354102.1 recombinase family protein [Hoyosella sp. YIM 151337]
MSEQKFGERPAPKAGRPEWNACLDALRPGATIWKIDRLGRNLRDLIDK